jgi:hypothetical protein
MKSHGPLLARAGCDAGIIAGMTAVDRPAESLWRAVVRQLSLDELAGLLSLEAPQLAFSCPRRLPPRRRMLRLAFSDQSSRH